MKKKLALLLLLVAFAWTSLCRAEDPPSFNREIRPILAAKCFACHGPDKEQRKAELRLDVRESALETGAIVPGKPGDSELISRIHSKDDELRMPPAKVDSPLTEKEKQVLKRWVETGARYEKHWAFVQPQRPKVPATSRNWPRNPIDNFVLARMTSKALKPSPAADRYTLVRRVYLDLIGLPPTPAEADAFVKDKSPRAYERLVNRLLESKHYGERWARLWLDLARYADTNGYEKDRTRSIWPYRDWVIRALNDDMPFDRFTIDQLAGDMLPGATADQRIATGFHRNTMLNEEGGIDPLEYRFYAMVDRVATTGTVWLGLTVGCAQCHSHKYDPVSHVEYYSLMALLNNADEPDLAVKAPELSKQRERLLNRIDRLEAGLARQFPAADGPEPIAERRRKNLEKKFAGWQQTQRSRASSWSVVRPKKMETNLPKLTSLADGSILSTGDITKRDVFALTFDLSALQTPLGSLRLEALPDESLPAGGPGRAYYEGRKGDFFLSEVVVTHNGNPVNIRAASHSFGKISIGSGSAAAGNVIDGKGSTGWSTAGREGEPHQLVLNFSQPIKPMQRSELKIEMILERHFAASLGRFRFSVTSNAKATAQQMPVEIEQLLSSGHKTLTPRDLATLRRYYLSIAPETAQARKAINKLRKQLPRFPITMVMRERQDNNPRKTFRHHRGEYLNPREQVTPGIPAVLGTLPSKQPANRRTLAKWLVSEANPLVGRVAVNRAWQAFFGVGLVRDSGDFGTQAGLPTHPQLLDWLPSGWPRAGR